MINSWVIKHKKNENLMGKINSFDIKEKQQIKRVKKLKHKQKFLSCEIISP